MEATRNEAQIRENARMDDARPIDAILEEVVLCRLGNVRLG
jgi:hypothetical protein